MSLEDMVDRDKKFTADEYELFEIDSFWMGVIASEGSFQVALIRSGGYKHGVKPKASFSLTMTEENVVREIKSDIGFGTISSRNIDGNRDQYSWQIQSLEESLMFDELIGYNVEGRDSKFSDTEKYESYEQWSSAVSVLNSSHRITKELLLEMERLRDNMPRSRDYIVTRDGIESDEYVDYKHSKDRNADIGEEPRKLLKTEGE